MTATTNEVILQKESGERITRRGVLFSEKGVDPATKRKGVILQYRRHPDDAETEFVADASIVSVRDEIGQVDCALTDQFENYSNRVP